MNIFSIISGFNIISLVVLFIWVFLSSFGIPGGLIAMISSGALATNLMGLIQIIIIAAIAAILGDILAYELARKFYIAISKRIEKYNFYKKNEIKTREFLNRFEFFSVFITRFALTGLCAITSYISGFQRLNRKKYLLAVISGEILYAIIYSSIGYIFRLAWNDVISVIDNIVIIGVLIVVALLLIWIVIRKRKKNNNKTNNKNNNIQVLE